MPDENANSIGSRIKVSRQIKGMTQSDLARELGTASTLVSKWERDEVAPRGTTRLRIANVLGVSAQWLQTGVAPVTNFIPRGKIKSDYETLTNNLTNIINKISQNTDEISSTLSVAIYILNNCLTDLFERFSNLTDEQAVSLAIAVSSALETVLKPKE